MQKINTSNYLSLSQIDRNIDKKEFFDAPFSFKINGKHIYGYKIHDNNYGIIDTNREQTMSYNDLQQYINKHRYSKKDYISKRNVISFN
jgi:hypothetical protein